MGPEGDAATARDPARGTRPRGASVALLVALVGGATLLAAALVSFARHDPPSARGGVPPAVSGLPGGTVGRYALYPSDDPWGSYLAGDRACPGGERTDIPLQQQADVMVCLVNEARARRGLVPLVPVPLLSRSALAKAERIVRCRAFAHDACDAPADTDARASGYAGPLGENLYVAEGAFAAPRAALDGWLNSPGHRANLFRPQWGTLGVAVEALPRFGPYRNAELWVTQFAAG